ncbi:MAG: hypothetical protein H7Y86_04365 [Rhizobacter sp.]|nr:hypothetical protein [Ferruginibacter sp.]
MLLKIHSCKSNFVLLPAGTFQYARSAVVYFPFLPFSLRSLAGIFVAIGFITGHYQVYQFTTLSVVAGISGAFHQAGASLQLYLFKAGASPWVYPLVG